MKCNGCDMTRACDLITIPGFKTYCRWCIGAIFKELRR